MKQVAILSKEDTQKVLKIEDVIKAVDSVYRQKAEGKAVVWPMVFYEFEPGVADMDIKSGWLKDSGIFGLKLVSWFLKNPEKGLPQLTGTLMVMNAETGEPLGFLDAAYITGIRTGAAGALGAKYLARPESEKLLLVGAGHVAQFQIAAMLVLFPELKEIMIYDPLDFEKAVTFAEKMPDILKDDFGISTDIRPAFIPVDVGEIEKAVGESDIIITVTPSRSPIIKESWVRKGTHFSCIGADLPGKEEIDPEIFKVARVFADDIPQCCRVGELEIPVAKGFISAEDVAGEIGDVATGKVQGRENDNQITIFDATGTALLDLITGKLALDKIVEA